jgi:DNA invertase Pin-like site-specific DNA recombinase
VQWPQFSGIGLIGSTVRLQLQSALERKRVAVRILNLGMDSQTPTGKLMLTVLGGVAQF